jgi:protein CpxP
MTRGSRSTTFDCWGRAVHRVIAAALVATAVPTTGTAQVTPPAGERRDKRAADPRRGELERRFQQRVDAMVRQRLQLTEEQAVKLREVAGRAETMRRTLRRDEMQARKVMRDELLAGDNANDAKVAELLEEMPRLERRRIDLMEQEQRELSKFLSPIQRARYFALQDELRRNMQELQRRRLGTGDSSRAPGRDGIDRPPRPRPPGIDR